MTVLRVVSISAIALVTSACATTGERSAARLESSRSLPAVDTNHDYVARVETIARRRGIDVHWVNMPIKRLDRDD